MRSGYSVLFIIYWHLQYVSKVLVLGVFRMLTHQPALALRFGGGLLSFILFWTLSFEAGR